jgi:hypothetical protein
VSICAGEKHSLALDADGRVWSFGSNSDCQLGLGQDVKASTTPKLVSIPTQSFSDDFDIYMMEEDRDTLATAPREAKIKSIACGARHSIAIDENGFGSSSLLLSPLSWSFRYLLVYGWGWSGYMQLGQNELDDVPTPQLIDLPEPISSVACGTWHSLFLSGIDYSLQFSFAYRISDRIGRIWLGLFLRLGRGRTAWNCRF